MSCTVFWKALVYAAAMLLPSVLAQEPASPKPDGGKPDTSLRSARLIACPDCLKDVSRRALSCPHCGCPGLAIAEAVAAAEQAARPLPVLRAESDRGSGNALVITENGNAYALLDARLLAGAETLTLTTVHGDVPVSYMRLEAAADAGLVRLALAPQDKLFLGLQLAPVGDTVATNLLNRIGKPMSAEHNPNAKSLSAEVVASIDSNGRVINFGLPNTANGNRGCVPITPHQKWIAVSPADYRTQTALLQRFESASGKTVLSLADRAAIEGTSWATPYLQKAAALLLGKASQP